MKVFLICIVGLLCVEELMGDDIFPVPKEVELTDDLLKKVLTTLSSIKTDEIAEFTIDKRGMDAIKNLWKVTREAELMIIQHDMLLKEMKAKCLEEKTEEAKDKCLKELDLPKREKRAIFGVLAWGAASLLADQVVPLVVDLVNKM